MTLPVLVVAPPRIPALVAIAGERAGLRFLEFFAANIRNPHTRRAYARAADEFLAWCSSAGVPSIGAVHPVDVATWIEAGTRSAHPLNASPLGLYFTRAARPTSAAQPA
jgi:hypothetical protein